MQVHFVPTLAVFLAATAAVPAAAAAPSEAARDLAATCAGCHGTSGASIGGIPSLAGMERQVIVGRMREFRSGARPGTVMPQLAKGYSDQQIESIAQWYAARKGPK